MTPETIDVAGCKSLSARFDLAHLPTRKTFEVVQATDRDLHDAVELAVKHFPHVKEVDGAIWRVHHRSRSILVARGVSGVIGTCALLCLNQPGLDRLRSDAFSVVAPDEALLTQPGEVAAAIYAWMLCLPGTAVSAMGQIMRWLQQHGLAECDLYACAGSNAGERFMRKTGFRLVGSKLCGHPLWIYPRAPHTTLIFQD